MSRTAAPLRRGDKADALGKHGKRFLARGIEEALGVQALFQLIEGELQRAEADRLDVFDIKLIFAAGFVDADGAAHGDVQAVLGTEFQAGKLGAETDAANLRAIILEREIEMAGLGGVRIGHFALDEDVGKLAGEEIADAHGEVAHRPDGAAGHQRKLKGLYHGQSFATNSAREFPFGKFISGNKRPATSGA